jgi:lipopolysaccharide/colanic/teichoic acid biosynthesis glycosyltransferase
LPVHSHQQRPPNPLNAAPLATVADETNLEQDDVLKLAELDTELDTVGPGLQIDGSATDAVPTLAERKEPPISTVLNGKPARHFVLVASLTGTPSLPVAAAPSEGELTTASPPHQATPTPSPSISHSVAASLRTSHAHGPARRGLGFLHDLRLKRAIDVAGSLTLLGMLSPVLGACAAAVRLSSPGPVLFRQQRIGRDGRPFQMLKFRTMYHNADQTAHQQYVAQLIAGTADAQAAGGTTVFKLVGDRRITTAGRWLRRLSLDELPQLINVLRGDMSLVGPRPPLPYEVEHYAPRHLGRLTVTPGITGLWQVSGRSRTTFEEMIDLDLTYIERWSVGLDLRILLRTVPVVIFPDGH